MQYLTSKGLEQPIRSWHPAFLATWKDGSKISVAYGKDNNLPMSTMFNESTVSQCATKLHLCVTDAAIQNLTEAQKELLRWHF